MAKSDSSGLGHMVILFLLLSILFHHSESALPSDLQNLSIAGRRMMAYYKPSRSTPPPRSAPRSISKPPSRSTPSPRSAPGSRSKPPPSYARPSRSPPAHGCCRR